MSTETEAGPRPLILPPVNTTDADEWARRFLEARPETVRLTVTDRDQLQGMLGAWFGEAMRTAVDAQPSVARGLAFIDLGDYYRPGDGVWLDLEPDGGYVRIVLDTERSEKDAALTPPQARVLAAALVHCAGEVER